MWCAYIMPREVGKLYEQLYDCFYILSKENMINDGVISCSLTWASLWMVWWPICRDSLGRCKWGYGRSGFPLAPSVPQTSSINLTSQSAPPLFHFLFHEVVTRTSLSNLLPHLGYQYRGFSGTSFYMTFQLTCHFEQCSPLIQVSMDRSTALPALIHFKFRPRTS